jgi:hypothetical protein
MNIASTYEMKLAYEASAFSKKSPKKSTECRKGMIVVKIGVRLAALNDT